VREAVGRIGDRRHHCRALTDLAGWRARGWNIRIAVNVSAQNLHNPAFHVKVALLVLALVAHFTLRRSGTRFAAALSLTLWTCVVVAARAIIDFDV